MKKLLRLCAIVVAIFMLATVAACSSADKIDELNDRIAELESELSQVNTDALNDRIAELEGELSQKYDENAYEDNGKIPYEDLFEDEYYKYGPEGAASVEREGDVENSPYFVVKDFYNMESTDTLTLLEGFKTIQQGTEWTCGPTSALMVLEWFAERNGMNELDLARLRRDPEEGKNFAGATTLREMIRIFEALNEDGGEWIIDSTFDIDETPLDTVGDPTWTMRDKMGNSPELDEDMIVSYLERGIPVIIGTDEWGGHWTVVIGYDNMGTETTADDVLIIADPYDTTDHCQDGYVVQSFERLYWNWKNTFDPIFGCNVFLAVYPDGI